MSDKYKTQEVLVPKSLKNKIILEPEVLIEIYLGDYKFIVIGRDNGQIIEDGSVLLDPSLYYKENKKGHAEEHKINKIAERHVVIREENEEVLLDVVSSEGVFDNNLGYIRAGITIKLNEGLNIINIPGLNDSFGGKLPYIIYIMREGRNLKFVKYTSLRSGKEFRFGLDKKRRKFKTYEP